MDIEMPVMNGFLAGEKILKILKEAYMDDYCRIVAITSYTDDKTRQKALEIGFKDVMHKPVKSEELQLMVLRHFFRREV
jgi:CheY-like chemotaxis protein